jgi:anti-sigma B factor antagonist
VDPRIDRLPGDGVIILRLLGEHDLASAPSIRESVEQLAREDVGVVVDVSETEFLDVAVIRALLDGDVALRERGRRLVVHNGTPCPVSRILELVAVDLVHVEDAADANALARERGSR